MGIQQILLGCSSSVRPGSVAFTSPLGLQSWTVPATAGGAYFRAMAVGGGGGGGGGTTRHSYTGGAGGGAGAKMYAAGRLPPAGTSLWIIVGAGGAGGGQRDGPYSEGSNGTDGGITTLTDGVSAIVTARGGVGGQRSINDTGTGYYGAAGQAFKPTTPGYIGQIYRAITLGETIGGNELGGNVGVADTDPNPLAYTFRRGQGSIEDFIWATLSSIDNDGVTTYSDEWTPYGVQGSYGVFGGDGSRGWDLVSWRTGTYTSFFSSTPRPVGGVNSYWAGQWYYRLPEVGVAYGGGGGGGGAQNEYASIGPNLGTDGAAGASGGILLQWRETPYTI